MKITLKNTNFLGDIEKLLDMKEMKKEAFLASYSYLTEEEYDNTLARINDMGGFESYKFSSLCFSLLKRDELTFRLAVSEMICKGVCFFESLSYDEIRENSVENGLMTKEFVVDLETMAKHLSRLNHVHLLNYISHNVEYDVGDTEFLSYYRYKEIAERACDVATSDAFEYNGASAGLEILEEIGLSDDEIESLGYGWALPEGGREE